MSDFKTRDFWYDLPEELIAQTPLQKRDTSRLLTVDRKTGALQHKHFYDILDHLNPGDTLVMNDSRVLPARLLGHRPTGGAAELLLLRDLGNNEWECLAKPGRKLQEGAEVLFGDGRLTAKVIAVKEDGNRVVKFDYQGIFLEVLESLGKMPLPPYIKEELQDQERYQTVYSREVGSAAAPTAGLHWTKELLQKAQDKGVTLAYVTLHVGLGTFRPVKVDDVTKHKMHSEHYEMSQETAEKINNTKKNGGRVIAEGTTCCRTLESVCQAKGEVCEYDDWTSIFIYPGYEFKCIDALLTNFHLP
jgi:S-adenosylmethionine:tRNA ribosyltransferase-isomerase